MQRVILFALAVVLLVSTVVFWPNSDAIGGGVPAPGRSASEPPVAAVSEAQKDERAHETARTAVPGAGPAAGSSDPAAVDPHVGNGRIEGAVLDAAGQPVAGANVLLMREIGVFSARDFANLPFDRFRGFNGAVHGQTDAQGKYALHPPLADSAVGVYVLARGYVPAHVRVAAPNGARVMADPVRLERGCSVSGRVVDPSGRGIAGAGLRVRQAGPQLFGFGQLRETDANGVFEVLLVDPKPWRLTVEHSDYLKARHQGKAPGRGEDISGVVITLRPGATIEGVVAGLPEGAFRLHAMVATERSRSGWRIPGGARKQVAIAADGSFRVGGLEADARYLIAAFAGSRSDSTARVSSTLEVGAGSHGLRLEYSPGASVVFRAVDARNGSPLPSVHAILQFHAPGGPGGSSVRRNQLEPDANGVFQMPPARPEVDGDPVTVIVESSRHAAQRVEGVQLEGDKVDLGTLRMVLACGLQVSVSDAQGQPVVGAPAQFTPDGGSRAGGAGLVLSGSGIRTGDALTDGRGIARLRVPEPRVGSLSVQHPEFVSLHRDNVSVPKAGGREAVVLERAGTVLAHLVDSAGSPVPGERVVCSNGTGGDQAAEADAGGIARIRGLRPGAYTVGYGGVASTPFASPSVPRTEARTGWSVITVEAGKTTEVSVTKPAMCRWGGRVTVAGEPLPGAVLCVGENRGFAAHRLLEFAKIGVLAARVAKSDRGGDFELTEIPAGPVTVRVYHPRFAMGLDVAVQLSAGQTRQDVVLEPAQVQGRVVDTAGQPIEGARVTVFEQGHPRPASTGKDPARTGADGSFRVEGVRSGVPLRVRVQARGFARFVSTQVRAQPSQAASVEVRLAPGCTIEVRANGVAPVVQISARHSDGTRRVAVMRNGRAVLSELVAGRWTVELMSDGGPAPRGEVVARPDAVATVALR